MNGDHARLDRECRTFVRLLAGGTANDYLLEKYRQAHDRSAALRAEPGFDARLLAAAAMSPLLARLADGYARHFLPDGALRRKLVLTLALVEVTPPYSNAVQGFPAASIVRVLARLAVAGIGGVVVAVLGVVVFGPVHLVTRRPGSRP